MRPSLGIIPELEFDCVQLPGDSIVAWASGEARTAALSTVFGGKVERTVPWSALRYRQGRLSAGEAPTYRPLFEQGAPRRPHPGDICRVEGDPGVEVSGPPC